jgi:hypothetical protein
MRKIPTACIISVFFCALSCAGFPPAPGGGTNSPSSAPELFDLSQYRLAERTAAQDVVDRDGALPDPAVEQTAADTPHVRPEEASGAAETAHIDEDVPTLPLDEALQAEITGLASVAENVPAVGLMLPAAPALPSEATEQSEGQSVAADTAEASHTAETASPRIVQPTSEAGTQPAPSAAVGPAETVTLPPYADTHPFILSSPSVSMDAKPSFTSSPSAAPAPPLAPVAPVDSQPGTSLSTPIEAKPPVISSPFAPADALRSVPAGVPTPRQATSSASAPGPARSADVNPQSASPSQTGETQARVREIYARVGDEVEIGLEGQGFVFLGFPDKSQSDGMSFKSKEVRNGKTYFKFKAFARGAYELIFLQQDNTTAKTSRETVRIHVVSDEDFAGAVNLQAASPAPEGGAPDAADAGYAERLAAMGKYQAALAEYLRGYREGDMSTNDRIAALYYQTGDYEAAEKYYKKNLSPAGPYTEGAVLGLVRIAIQRRDSAAFLSYLKPFLAIKAIDISDDLLNAARFQKEKDEIGVGLELLGKYTSRYPQGRRIDEAEYLTAQLLEGDSPFRDIQRARDIYGQILQSFPESPFASPARDRLRYIEQHFFFVR